MRSRRAFLAFRHNPIAELHAQAMSAARIAECAHRQGKFWATHDRFFQLEVAMTEDVLLDAASRSGVQSSELAGCLAAGEGQTRVELDLQAARAMRVTVTPYILIGRATPAGVSVVRVFGGLPAASELIRAITEAGGSQ